MPGLGKTTLANSVYRHPSVGNHFHARAWCCVSQFYCKKTLLSSILGQICNETNGYHEIDEEDVIQKLYQNLKGRRYLIVLDDIGDIESWKGLMKIFPVDETGSRILFTTQSHAVASQAKSVPYTLRLLSNDECCELLRLKLFNEETCPHELSTILKRIATSCKGLPLAVVLVAGILKNTKRDEVSWKQVAKTLINPRSIQEKMLKILEASYNNLPDYLKPCFLYFGTFPKSTTISVSKMIRLWICEGFVHQQSRSRKRLKQEADSYLNDLIDRSLVMIARKSSKGGVKACRIHDILQEFCSLQLEKQKSTVQKVMCGGIALLYGDFRMRLFSNTKKPDIYSLFYSYKSDIDMDSTGGEDSSELVAVGDLLPTPSCKKTPMSERVFRYLLPVRRSILSDQVVMYGKNRFGMPGTRTSQHRQFNYGSILKYKNVKVLDLGNVKVQSGADTSDLVKISKLVRLKYLAVRVHTTQIPSEIGNLQNLETFVLSGVIGEVMLPEAIWKLTSLRYITMDHSFFSVEHYSQEFFEQSYMLDKLTSVSTLFIGHGNVEKFMRRLAGVQKLGCIFSNSWQEYYEASNLFKVLELLCELESLKMSFHARAPCPFKFGIPSNLRKLTMSNARLPWDQISVIGQLPNLEVLKLLNRSFAGQQWDMREGEFQKLKFLKLDSLDIVLWKNASSEHLPCLEQLALLSCERLEEIPSSFGEIVTLQLIEMKWCSASATKSVKQILQRQRDFSNDQFNVTVVGPAT